MGTETGERRKDVPTNVARIIRQVIITLGAIAVVAVPLWLSQRDGAPPVQSPPNTDKSSLLPLASSGGAGETRASPPAGRQSLPLSIIDRYTASGWMGDGEQGRTFVTVSHLPGEVNGRSTVVVRVVYEPGPAGWAGVYWQYPPDNWGGRPGLNLRGGKELAFLARGEAGGEIVEFKSGGIRGQYPDSFEAPLGKVVLAREWRPHRIDLSRQNLSNVVGAFAWVAAAADNGNRPITFYLADILIR